MDTPERWQLPSRNRIHTDSKIVFDGVAARKNNGQLADLWDEVWILWDKLKEKGWQLIVLKVKAHTTDSDLAEGKITLYNREGNNHADHWADDAAEENQISWQQANFTQVHDATAWLIHQRMIAICQEFLPQFKAKIPVDENKQIRHYHSPLDLELGNIGHEIVQIDKDLYNCGNCGQSWHRRERNHMIFKGQCPGPTLWEGNTMPYHGEKPIIAPKQSQIMFLGAELHSSHHIVWFRGCTYCNKCGVFSRDRVGGKFKRECLLKPRDIQGYTRLKNMNLGTYP